MPDIPDELMSELLKTFQVEASEHLESLNQALLKIERVEDDSQRRELVQTAFRAAHSLKGAARAVGLQEVEVLAASIENVLQQTRDTDTLLEPQVCDVLYRILDGVQHTLDGQSVAVADLQAQLAGVGDWDAAPPVRSAERSPTETEESASIPMTDETIRITVGKLDELMAQTGELLISKINAEQRLADLQPIRQRLARSPRIWREIKTLLKHVDRNTGQRLQGLLGQQYDDLRMVTHSLDAFAQALNNDVLQLGMITTDLQEDVRRARMLPFQTMTLSLERAVRDAARTEDKSVEFVIEGRDVELDKKVLETLKDPLLHLLRNAVSHGIEGTAERIKAGKPPEGHVRLVVRQRGSEVSLTVSDDGRGFDLAALRQAHPQGTLDGQENANPDDAIALAFLPGVTTSRQVTAISGRGIGLDVVRQRIEDIHGRISVDNNPGRGAVIELIVPSSVTMTRGLMVRCGSEHFVLPLLSIERIVEVRETLSIRGKQMLRLEQATLPLVPLATVLERSGESESRPAIPLAVVISVAEQRLALLVDEVLSEFELAVKPLGEPLQRIRNVAGAALLGTGEPIVVLNPGDLVRAARGVRLPERLFDPIQPDQDQHAAGQILVVDDSITTRTLEKNILEAAGYSVTIAFDGIEALKRLDEGTIDLIVTDIQMPNMDGFDLTRQIRETAEYKHLPIILVTSLESQEDREKGMLAGADAYIVKRGFNQSTLLSTIEKFLEG